MFRVIMLAIALYVAGVSIYRAVPLISDYSILTEGDKGALAGHILMFTVGSILSFFYYRRVKHDI